MSRGGALAQVRSAVEKVTRDGRHEEAIEYSLSALAAVLQQSRELELLVAKLWSADIGKRSEHSNAEQLALLLEELLKKAPQSEVDPEVVLRYRERRRAVTRQRYSGSRHGWSWKACGRETVSRVRISPDPCSAQQLERSLSVPVSLPVSDGAGAVPLFPSYR